jgi:hypothetical protein
MKFLNLGLDLFLQPFILCYHYTIAVDSHWFARSNLYGEYHEHEWEATPALLVEGGDPVYDGIGCKPR